MTIFFQKKNLMSHRSIIKKWCIPYRFEFNHTNRILSFPLEKQIHYPKSGINHQRDAEGGSEVSYKKFYNSEYGKGLQR